MIIQPPYDSFRDTSRKYPIEDENINPTQVYESMLRTTKTYVNMLKSKANIQLLKELTKHRIGTTTVENTIRKLCSHPEGEFHTKTRLKILDMVMKEKLSDAYRCYRKKKYESNKIWRESRTIIKGNMRGEFLNTWRRYVTRKRKEIIDDVDKKVEWLKSKWKQEEVIPKVYEDIIIDPEDTIVYDNSPRVYGADIDLTEEEKAVLSLPPKFAMFEKIDLTECRIRTEEALNKLRWNRLINNNDSDVTEPQFFDANNQIVDINNLKATTLPFNPKVSMPGPVKQQEEVRLSKFRDEVMEAAKKCSEKTKNNSNLTASEKKGLTSLKKKIVDGDVICCVTDKSGRWACDTRERYKEVCLDELRDESRTPAIGDREHDVGERELNSHSTAILRMMGLKEGQGTQGERLRRSVQANGTGMAPFYGLRKDHKEVIDIDKGPRVRPLCGAKECSTRRVSYLLCQLLTPLIGQGDTQCGSTDELLNKVEKINRARDADPRWTLGSLDVKSLYPSLDIDKCSKIIAKAMLASDIVYKGLKWCEIGLYLRYNADQSELDAERLNEWCPRRKNTRGAPPKFEGSGSALDPEVRFDPWIFPDTVPDNTM